MIKPHIANGIRRIKEIVPKKTKKKINTVIARFGTTMESTGVDASHIASEITKIMKSAIRVVVGPKIK